MGLQEIERLQIPTPESFLPLYFQLNLGSCQGKGSAGLARCAVKHVCKALALLMADLPDAGTPQDSWPGFRFLYRLVGYKAFFK